MYMFLPVSCYLHHDHDDARRTRVILLTKVERIQLAYNLKPIRTIASHPSSSHLGSRPAPAMLSQGPRRRPPDNYDITSQVSPRPSSPRHEFNLAFNTMETMKEILAANDHIIRRNEVYSICLVNLHLSVC